MKTWNERDENLSKPHGDKSPSRSVRFGAAGTSSLHEESWTSGKDLEAEQIKKLLKELSLRRPSRIQFVPLDVQTEGEGKSYLHGLLEVRLILSEDRNRLLVRVGGGPHNASGRLFDVDDFVARAEAIEARKNLRPNPIAEEAETVNSPQEASLQTSLELRNGGKPPSSLWLRHDKDVPSPSSSVPWKKNFKAHWGTR